MADEGLIHAFCVDPKQSKAVATFVAHELQKMGLEGLPPLVAVADVLQGHAGAAEDEAGSDQDLQ